MGGLFFEPTLMPDCPDYLSTHLQPQVWQEFLAAGAVQPCSTEPLCDWHKGRYRYWVWALLLTSPELEARLALFRQSLAPYLLPEYHRAAHITLAVAGFVVADGVQLRYDDDVTTDDLKVLKGRISQAPIAPFRLNVGGFNSFRTAPYLEVETEDGSLQSLRDALLLRPDDYRQTPFVPHVTIGLYGKPATSLLLQHMVQTLDCQREPISIQVNGVSLISYDSHALGGALHEEWRHLFRRSQN